MINAQRTREDEIDDAAREFIDQNPMVMVLFIRFTGEMIDRGFKHYSAAAIFERIRWETDKADGEGRSTFKLNNNFRAYFARSYMRAVPEHEGFFRIRNRPSEFEAATDLPELGPEDFPYAEH